MTTFDHDFFRAGVRAGVERADRHHLRPLVQEFDVQEVFDRPLEFAQTLLEREGVSERFTELFAEMLTVAIIARRAYDDPPLTEPEIESYLQHSSSIFNSFRHA